VERGEGRGGAWRRGLELIEPCGAWEWAQGRGRGRLRCKLGAESNGGWGGRWRGGGKGEGLEEETWNWLNHAGVGSGPRAGAGGRSWSEVIPWCLSERRGEGGGRGGGGGGRGGAGGSEEGT